MPASAVHFVGQALLETPPTEQVCRLRQQGAHRRADEPGLDALGTGTTDADRKNCFISTAPKKRDGARHHEDRCEVMRAGLNPK